MSTDTNLKREELIRSVENGSALKEAAELEIQRLGMGTLLPSPDAESFDPMRLDRWSLVMALVWVLARNEIAVRNSWNDYITSQWEWRSTVPFGPPKACRKQPRWMHAVRPDRISEFLFEGLPGRSFAMSQLLLKRALANGEIRAFGRDLRRGIDANVEPIPAANWDALQIGEYRRTGVAAVPDASIPDLWGRVAGEDMLHFEGNVPIYVSVTIERAGLVSRFPASSIPVEASAAAKSDPVGLLPADESSPVEYRRQIRLRAMAKAFPGGRPKSIRVKERNRQVEAVVHAIDESMPLADEREWRRLWDEDGSKPA